MSIHRRSCAATWESLLKRRVEIVSSSSQYDTDFYVLDKYPLAVRPFYTMPDPNNLVSLSHTHCLCCFSTICIHTWYIAEGRNSFSIFTILSVVKFYGALWCICKVVCSIVTILPHAHFGFLHLGRCPSVSSDFASAVVFFVFFHSFLLTLTFYLTADASPFFSPSCRNIPTPTTCSCEGRRSCLELRESTMLRCWLRGRRITRSVRKRSSLHYTVHVICLPLLAFGVNYNSTMPWAFSKQIARLFFFCLLTQIWRRSSPTSTPSVMERPHMAVEELVSTGKTAVWKFWMTLSGRGF